MNCEVKMAAERQDCKQTHLHVSRWSSLGRCAARQREGPRKADFPQFSLLGTQCGVFRVLCTKIAAGRGAPQQPSAAVPGRGGAGMRAPPQARGCRQEAKAE